jgi:hypothetical protein
MGELTVTLQVGGEQEEGGPSSSTARTELRYPVSGYWISS